MVSGEDVVNPGDQGRGVRMPWADHLAGLRNGSFAGGYCFTPLDRNGSLVAAVPEPSTLLAAVSTADNHRFHAAPATAMGVATLAGGGERRLKHVAFRVCVCSFKRCFQVACA